MNVFDTDSPFIAARPGHCPCCAKAYVAVTGPASDRLQYWSMTGLRWHGSVSLNLHRDFDSLGLGTADVPQRATLCLVCAVDYMVDFNARLQVVRTRGGKSDAERALPSVLREGV